uniref:Uncharacterized protein n=1 Tax=Arundo donax TaxID=35708 RepID=A0A0A9A2M4_ARUDO
MQLKTKKSKCSPINPLHREQLTLAEPDQMEEQQRCMDKYNLAASVNPLERKLLH